MKCLNTFFFTIGALILSSMVSCTSTGKTYAELVDDEESYISRFMGMENIKSISIDEDDLTDWTKKVLNDSVHPSKMLKLNQWYTITEGDCKRLSFKIKSWGNDSECGKSFYKNKFNTGSFALVRYDSLFQLTDTVDINRHRPLDNLDPYDYQFIMNWNTTYYQTNYYAAYYGANKAYECTSGGLGFPLRFLWFNGRVSLIVPFSLVSSDLQSYYYTLYYGDVTYKEPTYIPD